jgi:hypothetical protein
MVEALLVVASVAVGVQVAAIAVIAVAIRREESAWSLGSPPRGWVQAAVRRLLGFRTEGDLWPQPKSRAQSRQQARAASSAAQDEPASLSLPARRRHR